MTIERVAKAIRGRLFTIADPGWLSREIDNEASDIARAALEAIEEPTPEMIEAGQREFEQSHWEDVAAAVWRAEHRAMMKEPK